MISWNMQHLPVWDDLTQSGADLALLQEVPGGSTLEILPTGDDNWRTGGWEKRPWRTAIARLSDRVSVAPMQTDEFIDAHQDALHVSRPGSIAVGRVSIDTNEAFVVASVYAAWERPVGRDEPQWADGSAHRILSDLSPLFWDQRRHPIIVAGDWNILRGYGEHGDEYYGTRYRSVFERAAALELVFVGPEAPHGRQADPWPEELPGESRCVPTYHHSRQTPATATRQLDFVFASKSIADRVSVRALNGVDEWGPSDHCRIAIDVVY
jgi:hypothetical protein